MARKSKEPEKRPARGKSRKAAEPAKPKSRSSSKPDAAKKEKFVEAVARHGNQARAVREAGWEQSDAAAAVTGSRLMADPDIRQRVEERRREAVRRAQLETDEIVGGLAEISTTGLGDIIDDDPFIQRCAERRVDHLIKKYKRTVRHTKDGERIETFEIEPYSRTEAYSQLRDTFGMKEEPRPNTLGDRRRREVEATLDAICRSEGVDRPAAAALLVEGLRALPNTEEQIKFVSEYAN